MMRFENRLFQYFEDWTFGRVFSDVEFVNCRFLQCHFSSINFDEVGKRDFVAIRSIARRITFTNAVVEGVTFIGPGIVEDSTIDGLKVLNHIQTIGTAFKHVVVKGVVDKLMLTPQIDTFGDYPDLQRAFDEANREYYRTVDWALDISEAEFKDCDIRGIPSRLIKRDPDSQVILTREEAMRGRWRDVDLSGTYWTAAIKLFLDDGYQDRLLVAPKKAGNFKKLLEGINKLRDAGIVEPD
jgi:hypothetical protein